MTDASLKPAPAPSARTRLPSGSRLAVVLAGGWIATHLVTPSPAGLGRVTAAGPMAMGTILALSFWRFARLGQQRSNR